MADTKISNLDAIASVAGEDLVAAIDDPSGTPISKKATVTQIETFLKGNTVTYTNMTLTAPALNGALTGDALAAAAEINTGTATDSIVTPDGLAGSIFGTAIVELLCLNDSQEVAVKQGSGDIYFRVPSILNGMNLVAVAAQVETAGTTGTMDIQVRIRRISDGLDDDMLSTKITIDTTPEIDSSTAAIPAVIDTGQDNVATGDQIQIDVDAVHTTPAMGLLVELQFRLP